MKAFLNKIVDDNFNDCSRVSTFLIQKSFLCENNKLHQNKNNLIFEFFLRE
jgi:hypothetical protein